MSYRVIASTWLCVLFIVCSVSELPAFQKPFKNVLNLKASFGDRGLPNEYLLAEPTGLIVLGDSNIVVTDESLLKVFDKSGHPVRIVGEQGQGPNEFEWSSSPTLSPQGYVVVNASSGHFNFYDKELNYLRKENFYTKKTLQISGRN